ncbi:BREX-1 system adenine-specific DNA-methyltransferase PglX [Streptomyces sp. NPDC093089]|uniref:BREX-1 system adenine-specific DNA-methyltransferase PglX n=1 Tax=Streptomyces sp. NPDC093089 TaxID=3366024 RepID=UPI003824563F
METAPLKSFAAWARAALIREVAARISVVLAPASPEQVEQRTAVAALEKAVNAAGGGGTGRAAVADKVAYTWFNRIIALRFMDANGYTGIGVVSPERGREGGQPEILAEAKRGNIDSTVVTNMRTAETVTNLLNSTRRSDDPQGEAYSLLLAEYCRHWNRSMPFMFEREGDYTELLMPANLLADDSVLARAVTVLTEDVCQDVEVIGWLYQFYISERKDEVFAGFKNNKKAGAAEIPAATQLFTPHWIVRYLVENSVGRLWLLNRPASRLADQMEYYIAPVDEETDYLKVAGPEELKVLDPACGSGHMLTYAFDLLYAIYEEEGYAPSDIPGLILANNLYGTEIDPRAGALAAFALTMKARSRQRTFFSKQVEPNVCVFEPISFTSTELDALVTDDGDRSEEEAFWNQFENADTFGSLIRPDISLTTRLGQALERRPVGADLIQASMVDQARRAVAQAEFLARQYAVVIANPPYMGSGNMGPLLSEFARDQYPSTKADLFAMFMKRCLQLTRIGGCTAMITMQSWMFLASFERLRQSILNTAPPSSMAHLGERAFDTIGGAVVSTAAFVLQVGRSPKAVGSYMRLVEGRNEAEKSAALGKIAAAGDGGARPDIFWSSCESFSQIPGSPVVYWLTDSVRGVFTQGRPLGEVAELREGLSSSDANRFVRLWWEVSMRSCELAADSPAAARASKAKWFPFNKGGDFRKWYGNQEYLINWRNGGEEILAERPKSTVRSPQFYFRSCASWSKISSGSPAFRRYQEGFVLGSAAKSIYVGSGQAQSEDFLMGICNSSLMQLLLEAKSPTMSFVAEDVGSLPIIGASMNAGGESIIDQLVENSKADWDVFETSWNFMKSPIVDWCTDGRVSTALDAYSEHCDTLSRQQRSLEESNNELVAKLYGLEGSVRCDVPLDRVTLNQNVAFRYSGKSEEQREALFKQDAVKELIFYAVGCMFGRYSLDVPGLILAEQGATLQDYLAKVPSPSFEPETDSVIPIVDGDWFEGDIVARFRQFLRAAFGEQHFAENLRFVTESLGVKDLRDYFVKSFYKDHVQRYKKRPIYWMFSSPKGSFNALIYMHRYTPSITSTVLNEYLREYKAKLEASRQHHERLSAGTGTPREKAAAQKEVDRLRKVLLELDEYEHDVLYPLATQQVQIDLDDGVKANYPKLGAALKKIPGLEASNG